MTAEQAEKLAQRMLRVAAEMGAIQNDLDDFGRQNSQTIRDNWADYEDIIIKGADIMHSLRSLAMAFDRAALIKFEG